jgi:hypothetical protein
MTRFLSVPYSGSPLVGVNLGVGPSPALRCNLLATSLDEEMITLKDTGSDMEGMVEMSVTNSQRHHQGE